jgi:hypothetical protein
MTVVRDLATPVDLRSITGAEADQNTVLFVLGTVLAVLIGRIVLAIIKALVLAIVKALVLVLAVGIVLWFGYQTLEGTAVPGGRCACRAHLDGPSLSSPASWRCS